MSSELPEEFKKWLCEIAGLDLWSSNRYNRLELLIEAYWAINRDINYNILMECDVINVINQDDGSNILFHYVDYSTSEQLALESALKYIWENTS